QHAEPPDLAGPAQSLQREAWILLAKCSCHLRTRRLDEFDGAVAQESLLRCQMQVHNVRMRVNSEGSAHVGRERCAELPMSRYKSSRAGIVGMGQRHPPHRNSS